MSQTVPLARQISGGSPMMQGSGGYPAYPSTYASLGQPPGLNAGTLSSRPQFQSSTVTQSATYRDLDQNGSVSDPEEFESDEFDADDPEYSFPSDIYSELLISFMHKEHRGIEKCAMFSAPLFLTILCFVCQMYGSWSVLRHVSNNMMRGYWSPVNEKLWLLAQKGMTLPKNIYEPICGEYEEYDFEAPDVAATIPLPPGSVGTLENIFFYAKMPEWTWSTKDLAEDRSILDTARFIIDEGYFDYKHGYGSLFLLVMFIWTCGLLVEWRSVGQLALFLCAVPAGRDDGMGCLKEVDGSWFLISLTRSGKCLAVIICIIKIIVSVFLFLVGSIFLVWTDAKVDLVLNSLALGFILELDAIIFQGLVSRKQQTFVDQLEPVQYKSKLPPCYRKVHRFLFPYKLAIIGMAFSVFIRWWQIEEFRMLYDSAALLCLFGGASPNEDVDYAPVAGFCESALNMVCQMPCTGKSCPFVDGKGSCVITDFDVAWPTTVTKQSLASMWPQDLMIPGSDPNVFHIAWNTAPQVQEKFFGTTSSYDRPSLEDIAQACYAMYKPKPAIELEVDDDTGEMGDIGPFRCKKSSGIQDILSDLSYNRGCSLWVDAWGKGSRIFSFCNTPHNFDTEKHSVLNAATPLSNALLNC